jgi:protein TonB
VSGGARLARVGAVCLLALASWLAGSGAAQAAAPHYWRTSQLDVRPQVRTHVMPEYPRELVSGTRGRVVLEIYLSATGTPDRVRVVKAEPPGRFENSALKAFTAARFTPGLRKGKAVPVLLRIEVTYGD